MSAPALHQRWSRFAFDPQHMTSDIEFDFPVPLHVSQAELQMLAMYMTVWQDYVPGSGLAVDIPDWAQQFLSSWNWTWTAVQYFVDAVAAADADLQEDIAPGAATASVEAPPSTTEEGLAQTAPRSLRPAKYGRCSRCGNCRQHGGCLTMEKSGATIAGTQAVDRWWQSLDRYIPPSLKNKDWCKGGLNQKLILYMHASVWRYHLPVDTDLKSELGKLK
eukprot:s2368_g6.t1